MPTDEPARGSNGRPIIPWTIVAGAYLHFALPAYLLGCLAFCSIELLNGYTIPEVAARLLRFSGWFATVYLVAALSTTAIARLLDPVLRRKRDWRDRSDPDRAEKLSRRRTVDALAQARSKLPAGARDTIEAIASADWLHHEMPYQVLSSDLAEVVRTSTIALETASPERRKELEKLASSTLERVAARLGELKKQKQRLDEGDLRTVAAYIEGRY